jgi:hypothetical protein
MNEDFSGRHVVASREAARTQTRGRFYRPRVTLRLDFSAPDGAEHSCLPLRPYENR